MTAGKQRLLVTGATGFVGRQLIPLLTAHGYHVRAATRRPAEYADAFVVGEIGPKTDWEQALEGIDCVIHLAGRAHVLEETATDPLSLYRTVNVEGTRCLARAAVNAGVSRFIYISSIKVNGESTAEKPFTAGDEPAPLDAYGITKHEAETALWEEVDQRQTEACVIRPPLVYGPQVKGNLQRLIRLVRSRLPLPLGSVRNARSLVSVDNLNDLIIRCVDHPSVASRTFLVSDGDDLSTVELIGQIGSAMGCKVRLLPVPPGLLRSVFRLAGRSGEYERLCGSLQVDIAETRQILNWSPPVSVTEGIRKMVAG